MNVEISLVVEGVLAIRTSIRSVCAMGGIPSPVSRRVIRISREDEDLFSAVIAACSRDVLRGIAGYSRLRSNANNLGMGSNMELQYVRPCPE